MLHLVITLCLLALGTAVPVSTDPKPCCVPEVFEGNVSISNALDIDGHLTGALVSATFHFDLKNKRVAQLQTTHIDGHVIKVNVVERASDNSTYIFYPEDKKCFKLPAGKISNCLSSDIKFALTLQLGINPSLDVDVYTMTAKNKTFYVNLSVTKTNCVPISQTVFRGSVKGAWASQTESFYDLAMGIKDASVFTVPTYCEKADVGPLTGAAKEAMAAFMERRAAFL